MSVFHDPKRRAASGEKDKIERIASIIKRSNNFLITSHINPEGDSLGSQLAMAVILEKLGKKFVVYNNDKVPVRYGFLPHFDIIKNRIAKKHKKFDVAIVMDCPTLRRTGRVKDEVKNASCVINIDHHVSNERFGDFNWVDSRSSSTGEMVYRFYKALGMDIGKEAALYMYIAILTDTGSFNYSNTSNITHRIVGELLGKGIGPSKVSQNIYSNKAVGEIKLLGRVLNGITLAADGRIAYLAARKSDFSATKTQPNATENFVNFARAIAGVAVAIFFREDIHVKDRYHISFRSYGEVDVNRVAAYFGGGGHKNASGCVQNGTFAEVKNRVVEKVRDVL